MGKGGGTGILGNGPGYTVNGFNSNGTTNWDALAAINAAQPNKISNGNNGSALRASVNNHFWYGLVSNYNFEANENFSFNLGADLRFYKGDHFQQLINLLGSEGRIAENKTREKGYVVSETFSTNPWSSLFNSADVDQRVGYDNSEKINYQGVFGLTKKSTVGTMLKAKRNLNSTRNSVTILKEVHHILSKMHTQSSLILDNTLVNLS